MKRSLALLALAGLALTGCSALTEVPAPAATSAAAATTAPSAAAAASVADYIAGTTSIRRTTQEWIDGEKEQSCRAGTFQDDPICFSKVMTAGMQAKTAGLVIEGMNIQKAKMFVGPPPADLAPRVDAAIATAKKVEESAQIIQDDLCPANLGCGSLYWDLVMGMQSLSDELESWAAYK